MLCSLQLPEKMWEFLCRIINKQTKGKQKLFWLYNIINKKILYHEPSYFTNLNTFKSTHLSFILVFTWTGFFLAATAFEWGVFHTLLPVSYTHLDVYKRQDVDYVSLCEAIVARPIRNVTKQHWIYSEVENMLSTKFWWI